MEKTKEKTNKIHKQSNNKNANKKNKNKRK
jgi:hypothetical protein